MAYKRVFDWCSATPKNPKTSNESHAAIVQRRFKYLKQLRRHPFGPYSKANPKELELKQVHEKVARWVSENSIGFRF